MNQPSSSIPLHQHQQAGFTLIEVMVAALILFSVIATVTMVYRGAFLASEKAENHISISGVLPSVLATVRHEVRLHGNSTDKEFTRQGRAWDIHYQWRARLVTHQAAPERFDVDSGQFVTPPKKYKLWQVELTLSRNGLNKQYQFNELSWSDE